MLLATSFHIVFHALAALAFSLNDLADERRGINVPAPPDACARDFPTNNYIYRLRNRRSGTFMTLSKGSDKDGTQAQGRPANADSADTFNQYWRMESYTRDDGCYYALVNVRSGTYAGLVGASSNNGVQVVGSTFNTDGRQLWKISSVNTDFYTLTNQNTNLCLDLDKGSAAPGGKIQGWSCFSTEAQHWFFERVSISGDQVDAAFQNVDNYDFYTHRQYLPDRYANYIAPPRTVANRLIKAAMSNFKHSEENFNHLDLATAARADLQAWARSNIKDAKTSMLVGEAWGNEQLSHGRAQVSVFTIYPNDISRIVAWDTDRPNGSNPIRGAINGGFSFAWW